MTFREALRSALNDNDLSFTNLAEANDMSVNQMVGYLCMGKMNAVGTYLSKVGLSLQIVSKHDRYTILPKEWESSPDVISAEDEGVIIEE